MTRTSTHRWRSSSHLDARKIRRGHTDAAQGRATDPDDGRRGDARRGPARQLVELAEYLSSPIIPTYMAEGGVAL